MNIKNCLILKCQPISTGNAIFKFIAFYALIVKIIEKDFNCISWMDNSCMFVINSIFSSCSITPYNLHTLGTDK